MRGFSLIELVLVLAIVAVAGGLAIPRYGASVTRYRAEALTRRIVADVAMAAARARALSASQTITFTPAANRYEIVGMKSLDHSGGSYTVDLSDTLYAAKLLSATCGSDSSIVFNGYGIPDSEGAIVVQVGSVQRTIIIDPYTGIASAP